MTTTGGNTVRGKQGTGEEEEEKGSVGDKGDTEWIERKGKRALNTGYHFNIISLYEIINDDLFRTLDTVIIDYSRGQTHVQAIIYLHQIRPLYPLYGITVH